MNKSMYQFVVVSISTTFPIFFHNFSQPGFIYPPDSLGRDTSCRRGGVQFRIKRRSRWGNEDPKMEFFQEEWSRFMGAFKYHQIFIPILQEIGDLGETTARPRRPCGRCPVLCRWKFRRSWWNSLRRWLRRWHAVGAWMLLDDVLSSGMMPYKRIGGKWWI